MKNVPGGHQLFFPDKETAVVIQNLYSKFKLMLMKNDETSRKALLIQLSNINNHLATRKSRFLTGETMCCFDCELMPRLQHIRIAGEYFANFEIPLHLKHLWKYMNTMYSLNAFVESCPADQDIIHLYKLQSPRSPNGIKKHEQLQKPSFTMNVPFNIAI